MGYCVNCSCYERKRHKNSASNASKPESIMHDGSHAVNGTHLEVMFKRLCKSFEGAVSPLEPQLTLLNFVPDCQATVFVQFDTRIRLVDAA